MNIVIDLVVNAGKYLCVYLFQNSQYDSSSKMSLLSMCAIMGLIIHAQGEGPFCKWI